MDKKRFLIWSLGVVTLACLVIAVFFLDNDLTGTASLSNAEIKKNIVEKRLDSMPVSNSKTINPTIIGTNLMQQMLAAKNVRAFVEQAKQQPEKGGVYIAETAVMDCKQAVAITDPKQHQEVIQAQLKLFPNREKNIPQALAAANQLNARCQGFTAEDYKQLDLYSGKLGEGRAQDPLIVLTKQLMAIDKKNQNLSLEQRLEHVQVLYSAGILQSLGGVMTLGTSHNGLFAVFFEGKPWGGTRRESLLAAQNVVIAMDTAADQNSFYWLFRCAMELQCETLDTQEKAIDLVLQDPLYARNTVDKQTFKKEVTELVPRLKQALDSKNFNAFAPPNKPAG
jgi:hypothetical protein